MSVPKFDFTEALKAVEATDRQAKRLMCGAKKVLARCPRCTRPTRNGKCPKCNPYEYQQQPALRQDVEKALESYKASLKEKRKLSDVSGSSEEELSTDGRSRSRKSAKKKRRKKEKKQKKKRKKKKRGEERRERSPSG